MKAEHVKTPEPTRDVPRRALSILNQPQVKFAVKNEIIKVDQDRLAFGLILAGKEFNNAFLYGLGKMIPPIRGEESPFHGHAQGINLLCREV
jgi:hypothetical protein